MSVKEGKRYSELMEEVEKPFGERKKVILGKHGKLVTPRKYHHVSKAMQEMQALAAATGGVINPFKNRVGAYWGAIESLITLGADVWHSHAKVKAQMEAVMTAAKNKKGVTCWSTFAERPKRADNGKDLNGRINQNFKVLQRLEDADGSEHNPYGTKLAQFKMSVDMRFTPISDGSENGTWEYMLNTKHATIDSVKPYYHNPVTRPGRKKAKKADSGAAEAADTTVKADAVPVVETFDDGGAGLAAVTQKED